MDMTATAGTIETVDAPKRLGSYRVPKSIVLSSCIVCIAATITMGFTWGGWVTSSTAMGMADKASSSGQAKLAATICADRFITGPHAAAQTMILLATDTAQRGAFIVRGGWLALPGMNDPVAGAADLCVQQIIKSTPSSG